VRPQPPRPVAAQDGGISAPPSQESEKIRDGSV
jgi:hypothetical protein